MNKICKMNVDVSDKELKYYNKVFKYCSFVPLLTFFLLISMVASGLVIANYLLGIIVILFTIYFLYTIKTELVGTSKHLYAGLILCGAYFFYDFSTYTVSLSLILAFVVFITFINGRELQLKRK